MKLHLAIALMLTAQLRLFTQTDNSIHDNYLECFVFIDCLLLLNLLNYGYVCICTLLISSLFIDLICLSNPHQPFSGSIILFV